MYSSHAGGKAEVPPASTHVEHPNTNNTNNATHNINNTSNVNNNKRTEYIKSKDSDLKQYSHLFGNPKVKEIIDRIVRVDQAGEFGAAKMYPAS